MEHPTEVGNPTSAGDTVTVQPVAPDTSADNTTAPPAAPIVAGEAFAPESTTFGVVADASVGTAVTPTPMTASAALRSMRPSYSARPEMTPAIPLAARAFSAFRSSSEDTPPEAITGVVRRSASWAVASTLGPARTPSRSMSV